MFLVSLLNKQLTTFELYVPDSYYTPQVDKRVVFIDDSDIQDFNLETFAQHRGSYLFPKEETAKKFAVELAKVRPDCQVIWAEIKGAFESVPSTPVEKSVTNKGILPV